jgi:hypothetical protein
MVEIYIRKKETDKAIEELEIIHKQFPEFPKEAIDYFNTTISLLKKNEPESAITQFIIFHNYLKVTSPYQAGIMDLKGPGGSLIGFPLITFDKQMASAASEKVSLLEVISVSFSEKGLPPVPKGWKRDFLIRCVGWVKDGDINTAHGQTVLPLPFHGMKSYPPGKNDIYPADAEHQQYVKEYNTRKVDGRMKKL